MKSQRDAGVLKILRVACSWQVIHKGLYVEFLVNWEDGCIQSLTCSPMRLLVAAQISGVDILELFTSNGYEHS